MKHISLVTLRLTWPIIPLNRNASTENLTASFLYGMNLERPPLLSTIHLYQKEKTADHGTIFFNNASAFLTCDIHYPKFLTTGNLSVNVWDFSGVA